MENVQIFWDPKGIVLDSLGSKTKSGDPADGDTPYVRMPIRMLGIDTPETSYGGGENRANEKLAKLKEYLESGNFDTWVDAKIQTRFIDRLDGAGSLQISQGLSAKTFFKQALDRRLAKDRGAPRKLFIKSADDHFDNYGRLLAYVAPEYKKSELGGLTFDQRKTFNLELIESGWASTIMIYPNLPKNSDLRHTRDAAKDAFENQLGAWAEPRMLTGYEYRMCMKLYDACREATESSGYYIRESSWVSRYCMDMTTLKVYEPQKYLEVPPFNRIFIWPDDIRSAVSELNLIAAS